MILYRTPGRSFTRPPRTSTMECSCRLWPTPGMYAVTSIWLLSRTRATLRRAELGFFGVVVYTRVHTPRRWGLPFSAGVLVLLVFAWRPLRTSCWIVGTGSLRSLSLRVSVLLPAGRRGDLVPTPAVGRVAWPHGSDGRSHVHRGVAVVIRPERRIRRGRTHDQPRQAWARGERVPTSGDNV